MSTTSVKQFLQGNQSYQSQLNSPEWHQFASEMRRAKGNACEACKRGDKPIQIHHIFYDFDRAITDYSPMEVVALCVDCHKEIHDQLRLFRKLVFRHLMPKSFAALNRALMVGVTLNDELEFAYAINELAHDARLVKNFCRAWTERKVETRIQTDDLAKNYEVNKRGRSAPTPEAQKSPSE